MKKIGLLLCVSLLCVGCGKVTSHVRPGVNLSDYNSVYVQHNPNSREKSIRDVDLLIQDNLNERGYSTMLGAEGDDTSDYDIAVNYADYWNWDGTLFLYRLEIDLRDPKDNSVLASGKYWQNPFFHWYPDLEKTVNNVIDAMFND